MKWCKQSIFCVVCLSCGVQYLCKCMLRCLWQCAFVY